MTNSTETKSPKKQGPLRTEAIIPVAIVFAATYLYFHFLFDAHIRKAIEWTSTYVHGAEVNVQNVRTSFLSGSFTLTGLQVTDKEKPAQNLLTLETIHFGFLWDALLRAKFVVEDASIKGIQIYSPRKKPGYVRPPEPPSTEPSTLAKIESNILSQTQEQFDDNMLGDLANLLGGTNEKDLLKNIQSELKSDIRIKALQSELKTKEKEWKERIDKLPQKEDLEALKARAKALKFDSKDPSQFAADVKEASLIAKEADAIADQLKDTSRTLKSDVEKYNSEFQQLDDLVKQDIKELETRLKIPDLNMKDFSKNLFGRMFGNKLASAQKYMEVGRKYMPPPKTPGEKEAELIPPPRGSGKTYRFPVTTGYPLFWLKKAAISSEPTADGFSGDLSGQLTDVSTDPHIVANPMILAVQGNFPKSQVMNTHLEITIDHRREPKETLALSVGQFPVRDLSLANSSDLGLLLRTASGSSQFNAELFQQQVNIVLKNQFSQPEYDLTAKSKVAKEAITAILAGIPNISVNAHATGSWNKLEFGINSNLGEELAAGLKKFVQAKVDEMKKQVKDLVDNKIKGEKDKLTQEYKKLKDQVDGVLKSKNDEIEKAKNDLKNQTKSQQSGANDKLKQDLKEKGKKLLKGIKF